MDILFELQDTLIRLGSASIKLASDNNKLINFEKNFLALGEKSPIFKKVAVLIKSLLTEQNNTNSFLELLNLVEAILATQSHSNLKPLEERPENYVTVKNCTIGYHKVQAIKKTLLESGNGRLERLKEYQNEFVDFICLQLMPHMISALKNQNQEIAGFVKETLYYKANIRHFELIKKSIDPQGGKLQITSIFAVSEIGKDLAMDWLINLSEKANSTLRPYAIYALCNCSNAFHWLSTSNDGKKNDEDKLVALMLCNDKNYAKQAWLSCTKKTYTKFYEAMHYIGFKKIDHKFKLKIFEEILPDISSTETAKLIYTVMESFKYPYPFDALDITKLQMKYSEKIAKLQKED